MVETLTLATVWLAMGAWTCGICLGWDTSKQVARGLWTLGLLSYLVHILCAYEAFYQWSHEIAWESTARDTEEVTGFDSGVGLLVNFAFGALLAVDLFSQWQKGERKWARFVDSLVLFMIVNGAVVFGDGPVRWFGVFLTLAIGITICYRSRYRRIKARENS
ncbi:MAG: hypothetical protein P1U87_21705 [Verrucomicrobiales bacterium]|nr:hypothetical protein [Verrucomicrobiales bacterium]